MGSAKPQQQLAMVSRISAEPSQDNTSMWKMMELIQLPPSTSTRVQLFSQGPGKSLSEPLSVTALPRHLEVVYNISLVQVGTLFHLMLVQQGHSLMIYYITSVFAEKQVCVLIL